MSQLATLPPRDDGFVRKKLSVHDCRVLVENGLLDPQKYELIEGEIIFKAPQGRLHVAIVTKLIAVLSAIFGATAIQTQAQIGVGEIDEFNDPEPDVAVLSGTVSDYLDREPDPATEILLAVEVANTSLRGDLTTKAKIYARNGVRDYWVVSIPDRELIVCRQPAGEEYTDVRRFGVSDSVSPLAASSASVPVSDILPG
jgi:Uma2 family endonuclease